MCQSNVFLKKGEVEELVFSEVMKIIPEGCDQYTLVGLLGDTKTVTGRLKEVNLLGHKIIIEAL